MQHSSKRNALPFSVGLPILMAFLLLLVPIIKNAAGPIFMMTLVPLALWAALRNTEKAIYVYLAWALMDGTIRGLFGDSQAMVVARDVILILTLMGWLMNRLLTRYRDPLRTPPGTALIMMFIVICLLQIANPYSLGLMPNLAGLIIHLGFIPLFFIGYDIFRRREQVRALMIFLTLATCVIGIVSVVQYAKGPAWTYAHFPGSERIISQNISLGQMYAHTMIGQFKPPGTTTFGGGTGGIIGVILPLTYALILLAGKRRLNNWARLGLIAIMFFFSYAMFVNGVRSGLVDGIVGVVFCALFAGGRNLSRSVLIGAVCVLVGIAGWSYSLTVSNGGTGKRFETTLANPVKAMHSDRMTFFEQFNYLIVRAPMGIGLGRVGPVKSYVKEDPSGINTSIFSEAYLGDMMSETGVLGALAISAIAIMFLIWGLSALIRTTTADDRLLVAGFLAILCVVILNFFVSPILLSLPAGPLFWLMGAIFTRAFGMKPKLKIQTNGLS